MTIKAKKIINSILIIALAALIAGLAYYFTGKERLLTGSILDGRNPADISKIEFVTPSGSVSPVNNVVEIKDVFVDFTSGTDGDLYGDEIANSFIDFKCTAACSGVQITDNKIFVPDDFTSFTVDIWLPEGTAKANSASLTITPIDCSYLSASIMRSTVTADEGDTTEPIDCGTFSNTSKSSCESAGCTWHDAYCGGPTNISGVTCEDFDKAHCEFMHSRGYGCEYNTSCSGNATIPTCDSFNDCLDSATTVELLNECAQSINANCTEAIQYGFGCGIDNASSFCTTDGSTCLSPASVCTQNALSPFTSCSSFEAEDACDFAGCEWNEACDGAFSLNCNNVTDQSACNNLVPTCNGWVLPSCTANASNTAPLYLNSSLIQGESALVYVAGSTGDNKWVSSSPDKLEVALLSEVEEKANESSAQFLSASLNTTGTPNLNGGTYTKNCTTKYDNATPPNPKETTCNITMTIPVSFPVPAGLHALVNAGGEEIPVTLEADASLTGMITGSGTWSDNTQTGGFSQTLTGTVSGTVKGYVSAPYDGFVNGTIKADVSANAQLLAAITPSELGVSVFPTMGALTPTSQLTAEGTFTSTVTKAESVITNQAVLYAKRPGKSILTVTDAKNCTASLEVEVIGQKVILQPVNYDPGDVLEVGDNVTIKAYVGDAQGGIDEKNNITTKSQWKSSNEKAATIQDGVLTAVAPGITQITATYNTGAAEIGEITSDPLTVTVNKVSGLTIALNEATQQKIPSYVKQAAYKSVLFIVHNPNIAGKSVNIEGQQIPITLPDGTYENNLEKVGAIIDEIQGQIALQNPSLINVKRLTDLPGVLVLEPTSANTNGIIDISTTATADQATIVPNFSAGLNLPANETYGLMVVANYNNGRTKRLLPTDVTWMNTPVNYLDSAMLATGLLKRGEKTGTSTIYAEFKNADESAINSNLLTVTVESGPVIEYARIIGSGAIMKGGQINLQMKVTDVDTIADIQDINISLVKSEFNTYNEINADSGAVWFTATPYPDQITVEEESATADGVTPAAPSAPVFKIYDIPADIPYDAGLFDGQYKLIISITDTNNNTLNYVYPIYIGEVASGDVDGNGVINMIDVIYAFRIAAGTVTPTQSQLQAADVNGDGGVTMIDVILLFRQVASS
jgi:hypothetical protein